MDDIRIVERKGRHYPDKGEAFVTNFDGKDILIMRCPRCDTAARLIDHELTIDDEGKPSITPSIGCQQCRFHAFLKHGKLQILSDY